MRPRSKTKKKTAASSKTPPGLPVLQPHAAGIDIGAREIYVAVPPGSDPRLVRTFATSTDDLYALRDWSKACGVTSVAMESTGVYSIPLYQILEAAGLEVCLVNARHRKSLPGRKTGGERRWGTWVNLRGHGEGRDDGRGTVETLSDRIATPAKVQKLQRALYRKAKAEPGDRFDSLDGELLRRDLIKTAMSAVASHDGAAGMDGQECSADTRSDEAWTQWWDTLLEELRTKTYRVSPVRRVSIPKGDGKTRPLGLPTVKDRVVQTAVAILLLPVWKADSHPQSYAYRSKRNAQQAMDAISTALRSGRPEVVDADLSGYFDSIPPRELLRLVARRVSDGHIPALSKAWLRAPTVECDPETGRPTITGNRRGTPQGGVISPLLANLYLNRLDWQVNDRCAQRSVLVRYADDFVILSRPGQGAELMARLKRWLEAHGFTLNETKTRLLDVRQEGFKFLGFRVSWRRGKSGRKNPQMEPHPKSQTQLRDQLREKLNHWTLWRAAEEVIPEVNRLLKRLGGYFHYANSTAVFDRMNQYAALRVQRWLRRKSGCPKPLGATNPREVLQER